ncbi:MAG: hypothetical protein IRZ00_15360 [Gemmatimonadetes bacterium]|nr:hypothetical protein [Gemmatimonadota bacterium]
MRRLSRPRPRHRIRAAVLRALAAALLAACGAPAGRSAPERDHAAAPAARSAEPAPGAEASAAREATTPCPTLSAVAPLPRRLRESSGLAASRRHPGVLWTLNDSGSTPDVFAIDTTGRLLGRVRVTGATNLDWEDLALAPCPGGDCLYIADTGDNAEDRAGMVVYRIPEPVPANGASRPAQAFPIAYPDRPRDTEALFVTETGRIFLVSKGRRDAVSVWRYPGSPVPGRRRTLERVQSLTPGKVELPDLVTGASLRGATVAVRTYTGLRFYRLTAADTLAPLADSATSLAPLAEPQGEGVALGDAGAVWFTSEAGPGGTQGTLSRGACRIP